MTDRPDATWVVQQLREESLRWQTTPAGDIILAASYQGSFQMTGGSSVTAVGATDIALVRVSSAVSFHGSIDFGGGPVTAAGTDYGAVLVKYSP